MIVGERKVFVTLSGGRLGTHDPDAVPSLALQHRAAMQRAEQAEDDEIREAWLDIAESRAARLARTRTTALNARR